MKLFLLITVVARPQSPSTQLLTVEKAFLAARVVKPKDSLHIFIKLPSLRSAQ